MQENIGLKSIVPEGTRPPTGHYSPAVVYNGLVYVSGQLPIDPTTGEHETGSIESQASLVFRNLSKILEAADSGLDLVLQVTVYTSEIEYWGRINLVYAQVFGQHKPARVVVPTPALHYGLLIEVSAIAAQRSD